MTATDVARSAILNEQELWREMVRWSGGLVHEQDGLLFVAGPSSYLRVAIRMDDRVDGVSTVRRSEQFFGASQGGHIVLALRHPSYTGLARAPHTGIALRAGNEPSPGVESPHGSCLLRSRRRRAP